MSSSADMEVRWGENRALQVKGTANGRGHAACGELQVQQDSRNLKGGQGGRKILKEQQTGSACSKLQSPLYFPGMSGLPDAHVFKFCSASC